MSRRYSPHSKTGFQLPLPSVCRENLEFGPLFPLFWPKYTSRRPRDRTLQPVRCPLGLSHLHINPCSHPRSLVQSLSATSLHAGWVHGPGPASRRGLGHWLQLLLRLPDVMELLELFHHVVFEVWV